MNWFFSIFVFNLYFCKLQCTVHGKTVDTWNWVIEYSWHPREAVRCWIAHYQEWLTCLFVNAVLFCWKSCCFNCLTCCYKSCFKIRMIGEYQIALQTKQCKKMSRFARAQFYSNVGESWKILNKEKVNIPPE